MRENAKLWKKNFKQQKENEKRWKESANKTLELLINIITDIRDMLDLQAILIIMYE